MKQFLLFCGTLATTCMCTFAQNALIWSKDSQASLPHYYQNLPTLNANEDSIGVIGKKPTPQGERLVVVNYGYSGNVQSTKTFGNDSIHNGTIADYEFSANGFLYIAYREKLGFYKSKIVLHKYDMDGNPVWIRQIAETADTSYSPVSLGLVNDSTLFMTALKEYNYPVQGSDVISTVAQGFVYAYHTDGTPLWRRGLNGTTELHTFLYDIVPHNGSAILFGNNGSNPDPFAYEYCMVKVGTDQSVTVANDIDIANGIGRVQITPDNNLLIAAGANYRVTKLQPDGTPIWTKLIPTNLPPATGYDEIKYMIQDAAGNIYVTGRHYGPGDGTPTFSNADMLTVKYDPAGNIIWQRRYQYGINNADIGNCLTLKNNKLYVGGESQRLGVGTDYDYVLLKINASTGQIDAGYRYNDPHNGDDALSALYVTDNGSIVLTGLTYAPPYYDWTTQLLSHTLMVDELQADNFKIYPNPVTANASITVEGAGLTSYRLISLTGQVVGSGNFSPAATHTVKPGNLPAGLYFLELQGNGTVTTQKILVK